MEEPFFSPRQQDTLTAVPCVTASISALSSSAIIFTILYDRTNKLKFVYQRLLLAMSVIDAIVSANIAVAGLLSPKSVGLIDGHGNEGTCELNGFLLQLGLCVPLYNLSLCIHYYLVIVCEWSPRKIKESRVEIAMHLVALLYPFGFGVAALFLNSFNPTVSVPSWCFYSDYPWDCNTSDEVDCVRGENYFYVQLPGLIVPLTVALVGVNVCMFRIWWKVRNQENRMERRYSREIISSDNVRPSTTMMPRQTRRLRLTPANNEPAREGLALPVAPSGIGSNNSHPSTPPRQTRSLGLTPSDNAASMPSPRHLTAPASYSVTNHRERTKQTAIQARLYSTACLLTYAAPIAHTLCALRW